MSFDDERISYIRESFDCTHPMLASSNEGSCDHKIYSTGAFVAVMDGASAKLIERLVNEASEACCQKMDWHYMGGRAVVRTLGDVRKCRGAIVAFMPRITFSV